jgi:hypothetical protein
MQLFDARDIYVCPGIPQAAPATFTLAISLQAVAHEYGVHK